MQESAIQAGREDSLAVIETVNNWALWRDAGDWERFRAVWREGYRHLAYLQTRIGCAIKLDLPQLKGPAVAALYAHGRAWLGGAPSAFPP